MGFYGEHLAHIHDDGFTEFIVRAIPGLRALLQEHGIASGRVVDLGCGSGVWIADLCRNGYAAVGIDVSKALLSIARHNAPDAVLIEGSFFDVEFPSCDAMTAIGECFNYVGNSHAPEESLEQLLCKAHEALATGGVLIFDVALPGRVGPDPKQFFVIKDEWVLLVEARESSGSLEREITTFRQDGGQYQRDREVHVLELREAGVIHSMAQDAGFEVKRLDGYGDLGFPAGHIAFCAVKK